MQHYIIWTKEKVFSAAMETCTIVHVA